MNDKKLLVLGILFLLCIQNVKAETAIAGLGVLECGKLVQMRRESKEASEAITSWTQAFLSGVNTKLMSEKRQTLSIPDYQTLGLMLESNCLKEPENTLWLSSIRVMQELESKNENRSKAYK